MLFRSETWTMRKRGYKKTGGLRNVVIEKNGENQLDREYKNDEVLVNNWIRKRNTMNTIRKRQRK